MIRLIAIVSSRLHIALTVLQLARRSSFSQTHPIPAEESYEPLSV